jgi:hypothetical protein
MVTLAYDSSKPLAGYEDFCDGCRSRYQTADYDCAEGTYQLSWECGEDKFSCEFIRAALTEWESAKKAEKERARNAKKKTPSER